MYCAKITKKVEKTSGNAQKSIEGAKKHFKIFRKCNENHGKELTEPPFLG